LFRGAGSWHGGDGAYSVDLGEGRVLWLFGDSFVEADAPGSRSGSDMVRNSIGIQQGYDPSEATMTFHHGGTREAPTAFFLAADPQYWLWPGPAVRVGRKLFLPFLELEKSAEGLGFAVRTSRLRVVDDPREQPESWDPRALRFPEHSLGVQLGFGAWVVDGEYLFGYAPEEPGDHDLHLARWRLADVEQEDFASIEWWSGDGFSAEDANAQPVLRGGQTEFSVHRRADGSWLLVSVDGFGRTHLVGWTAPAPEGPWNALGRLHTPPASQRDDAQILVYSAKAHPWLKGPGTLVTYCSNHLDFWKLAGDMTLYFPRFVALDP
jgi:hypothetical protein